MKLSVIILFFLLQGVVPAGPAFLKPLQVRDSVLVADQFEYGFELDSVKEGTTIMLPDFAQVTSDTLVLVRGWQLDTIKSYRRNSLSKIRGTVILSPFEAGKYLLPDVPVLVERASGADTLLFTRQEIEVKTIPVDTATFQIKDLKGQIEYPVTFAEVFPYCIGILALAGLIVLAIYLVRRYRQKHSGTLESKDPSYVVALRNLDKYRGNKYWAPEKQKIFYSGITDILKIYIEDRFGFDAPEMTTAEVFDSLKGNEDITPELFSETKELFETADFVKFAKHTVDDTENAKALPVAVKFITNTYKMTQDDVL